MTFDELRHIVLSSSANDWVVVPYGTTYKARFGMVGARGAWSMETDEHQSVAVYRQDIAVTIAWGMTHRDDLRFEWSDRFPDSDVSDFYVDVFSNGMLVDRWFALTVDGGRAVLPVCDIAVVGDVFAGDAEIIGSKAYESNVRIARLIHELEGSHDDFDDYLARSGITVLPDR